MTQRIEITDLNTNEQMTLTFPDRYVTQMLPTLVAFERLMPHNYRITFTPPLRIENEATGEHFFLGHTSYFDLRIPKPILFAAAIMALEEVIP